MSGPPTEISVEAVSEGGWTAPDGSNIKLRFSRNSQQQPKPQPPLLIAILLDKRSYMIVTIWLWIILLSFTIRYIWENNKRSNTAKFVHKAEFVMSVIILFTNVFLMSKWMQKYILVNIFVSCFILSMRLETYLEIDANQAIKNINIFKVATLIFGGFALIFNVYDLIMQYNSE